MRQIRESSKGGSTCEEMGSETALLYGSVAAELDAQAVTDGSHHGRDLRSTEHAVLLVLTFRRLAANFETIILTVLLLITEQKAQIKCQACGSRNRTGTHVIPLQVEVSEIQGNPVLRRCNDFPDAVLVRRIQVGERGRG